MSSYDDFFSNDPWKCIDKPCYPEGHRLYLDDERLWVSMDTDGHILFFIHDNISTEISPPENLAGIKIDFVKYMNNTSRLVCTLTSNDPDLKSKFIIVTKDIAYKCSGLKGRVLFKKVLDLIDSWASFLQPQRNGLSESEYIGLWGELYILAEFVLKNYSPSDAMRFWVGPEGKKQDFTFNKLAIEVKTTFSSNARSITISSLEQLEQITEKLYILHIVANPSDNHVGLSLEELYEKCKCYISKEFTCELIFFQKISDMYAKATVKQLNNKNVLLSETIYEVTDSFPCLRPIDIPSSIVNVKYDLLISSIREYESKKSVEEVIKNG